MAVAAQVAVGCSGGWSVLGEELLVEGCKHQRLHVKGERSGASM